PTTRIYTPSLHDALPISRRVPAAEGLLLGRGGADRRRGHLERRARVPEARGEERGDHAHVDGDDPRLALPRRLDPRPPPAPVSRSEEHTSELQSRGHLVC